MLEGSISLSHPSMSDNRRLSSYNDFVRNLHPSGASIIEFSNQKVPCIYLENDRFKRFVNCARGRKLAVDTNMDIYHNEKDVFVQIKMKVMDTALEDSFLLHANGMVEFFKAMLDSGLIVLSPNEPSLLSEDLFAIQLPKRDRLQQAFHKICLYTKGTGI
jgi:hypothetical protein